MGCEFWSFRVLFIFKLFLLMWFKFCFKYITPLSDQEVVMGNFEFFCPRNPHVVCEFGLVGLFAVLRHGGIFSLNCFLNENLMCAFSVLGLLVSLYMLYCCLVCSIHCGVGYLKFQLLSFISCMSFFILG